MFRIINAFYFGCVTVSISAFTGISPYRFGCKLMSSSETSVDRGSTAEIDSVIDTIKSTNHQWDTDSGVNKTPFTALNVEKNLLVKGIGFC